MNHVSVEITSFGHLYGGPPEAHVTLDLRNHFRDPHVSPELRSLTADDVRVRAVVMSTPGITALLTATVAQVQAFWAGPSGNIPVKVATGCAGGRHRAATTAMALHAIFTSDITAAAEMDVKNLAEQFTGSDIQVTITHRDLHKAVIDRLLAPPGHGWRYSSEATALPEQSRFAQVKHLHEAALPY